MKKVIFSCIWLLLLSCSDDEGDCGCKEYKTSVGVYMLNECEVGGYNIGWQDFVTEKEMQLKQRQQGCE